MPIILPKEKVAASRKSPSVLVIYASPKVGKTKLLTGLDNCLIIDLEKGTSSFDALKIQVNSISELLEVGKEIVKAKRPYKYVAIDTVSKLEDWAIDKATDMYKASAQGKNFTGNNVLELAHGYGYQWLRVAFQNVIRTVETWADNVILVGHVRDKNIEKGGKAVSAKDLDLTGKLKSITCAKADAIGFIRRREPNRNWISFIPVSDEEITCGARAEHLSKEDFLISEKLPSGEIKTHWERIYID